MTSPSGPEAATDTAMGPLPDAGDRDWLRLALDAAQLGTWQFDFGTGFLTVSPRAAQVFGVPGPEALASLEQWQALLHPDDRDRVIAAFTHAHAAEETYAVHYRVLPPDGAERWVSARGLVTADPGGHPRRMIGVVEDITGRKVAEAALVKRTEELAESEAQYRTMGEAIPFGVWLCDEKGGARYVSPSFLELLNMSDEEQQDFGWTSRLPPEDVGPMLEHWMHCIRTGEFWDYEHRIIDRHGEINTVLTRGRPVRDAEGKITSWVGVNLDITQRKRAEAQLAKKNLELEKALEQIRQLDGFRTRFFANVSHELRTPLTLILGPVDELLASGRLPPEWGRALSVVRRNAQTLLAYVNDLLDLSRLDAGRTPLEYGEADLAVLVRFVADHFAAAAAHRGIDLRVAAPDTLSAQVDAPKVSRVLFNLLSNAFKHVPDRGGAVEVALRADGERCTLEVIDNGLGVPQEMREAIFQRFVQGDDPQRSAGSGLGLAIAGEFVAQHGGGIAVDDAPGGTGAVFRVTLPLAAPAGTPVARQDRLAPPGLLPVGDPGTGMPDGVPSGPEAMPCDPESAAKLPLVLVVEDNPDLRAFVAAALGGIARVALAGDGAEGLSAAERLGPDLVLTDIMMPRMSGDEMVAALRARGELADVPVMVLSARADEPLRIRLLHGQVQDYLVKPFAADELRARVANLLQVKRARDLLRAEVDSRQENLEELAREVAALNRRLRGAADEMRVARDRAEQASRSKSAFLNMASHELRTPLAQLELQMGMHRRLFGPALNEKQEKVLARTADATRRLSQVVGSVLEYSRIESGRLTVCPERFDIAGLVAEACADIKSEAKARGQDLVEETAGDVPPLVSDPALVRIIVRNLLDNAVKHTAGGRISARVSACDGLVRVEVADTGPGIPAELQEKVFEPFVHVEEVARKHAPGMGLGLALSREIAGTLGGRVRLASSPGQGSVFTLELTSVDQAAFLENGAERWAS
ncbi:Histidine kinase (plasmid) [Rhodovastum atsumiense]|uniref:histidine kinase n=1 Tax=Rhodovastum atsumiense TaxID=504468 RepID=A0A5M6IK63_9PROT|nr:ATP-binding protein [Rhodovastum atsumiense]KAA5608297.1 PAS domain-containing protein [Rhodovastum atsumiense]CAH2605830.1 Histidine kinase [Rhodovastum atsumiense]